MKIYIVIPAYNEAKRIGEVLKQLKHLKYPVIVVDDGSVDQTFQAAKKHQITVLKHRINLGKGAALKTGCEAAFSMGADAVILMDSDGQHQVSDISKFVEKLHTDDYDVIFGSRNYNLGIPLVRFIGNKVASVVVSLAFGIYVSDLICGFRAFTKSAYPKLKWESPGYGVETEMVIRVSKSNLSRCEVPVEAIYYEKFKGVTILDALGIFFHVLRWRIIL